MIRSAQQPDGTWLQGEPHPGRVWFEVDAPEGKLSKWLTSRRQGARLVGFQLPREVVRRPAAIRDH